MKKKAMSKADHVVHRKDLYASLTRLKTCEIEGRDYRIRFRRTRGSRAAVIAPHGGGIEPGTSKIARLVAGRNFGFFLFEGLKGNGGNAVLHVTSQNFDEPSCLNVIKSARVVVAIHGCKTPSRVCIGGLDDVLKDILMDELIAHGLPAVIDCPEFMAAHPMNICNRGSTKAGAQLEISPDLRCKPFNGAIATATRNAVERRMVLLADSPASLA
jgi:phage replication-related protein YjqB (UPF0714/DUF867 family)